jgi:hypothetical protein
LKPEFKFLGKGFLGVFLAGMLWGIVLTFIAGIIILRHFLFIESEASGSFEDTVKNISASAAKLPGWNLRSASCATPRPQDGSPFAMMSMCGMDFVGQMVDDPESRKYAVLNPCGIVVYGGKDGKVRVARLNTRLLGHILGGKAEIIYNKDAAPAMEFLTDEIK